MKVHDQVEDMDVSIMTVRDMRKQKILSYFIIVSDVVH